MADIPNLAARVPENPDDPDALLDAFIQWAFDRDLELYPHQEEAVLEVLADRHVILNTPTGSGKSLVALAVHFRAFARGARSFYTSPIKALVSEKFFDLCRHFGADQVGMLTGDVSLNPNAKVLCCTQEVLAQIALSEGEDADVADAVIDEFHYYGDRDRGMAWQIPLLAMPQTRFVLMSATLGDTRELSADLEARSGREVALVKSAQRPVPLDFSYRHSSVLETIEALVDESKAPIYVVSFTQRETAELAQHLMSANFCSKEEKKAIAEAVGRFRFDTPFGKEIRRWVLHGTGIHHAGLLPKYRLLVERLAQQGLLKVISGTDTLGVGINVPLRTVLFTKLCKYDGQKTRILTVRDFKQIAGRAGRKGFDDRGWVVGQAPEHVVQNLKMEAKAADDPKKRKKMVKKKPPQFGYTHWDEDTFRALITSDSEALRSRFRVDYGMMVALLRRGRGNGYRVLIRLIDAAHLSSGKKSHQRRAAARMFRALRAVGVLTLEYWAPIDPDTGRPRRPGQVAKVSPELQDDFSIHRTLTLFLIHALEQLDRESDAYPLHVMTLVESILDDPGAVLRRQQDRLKREAYATMKAEGLDYDERQEKLEQITWPMPDRELVFDLFDQFARPRPWVRAEDLRPKSVARDMYEQFAGFNEYVKRYGLERLEGTLLRHLSQVYKTLRNEVPDAAKDERVHDAIGYLRATLERADRSLLTAWENMVAPPEDVDLDAIELRREQPVDVTADARAFLAMVRAELHRLVKALADQDYEEAAAGLRQDDEDPWDAERLELSMARYHADYERLLFDHAARQPGFTRLLPDGERQWKVQQVLHDPEDDNMWYVEGRVDLRGVMEPDGPMVALTHIGS
jgi:superfamily II RNA helicase